MVVVLLSVLIHAALGMLVVKKEAQKFVPPKAVERPKMKLRKPKVKKASNPKPTDRDNEFIGFYGLIFEVVLVGLTIVIYSIRNTAIP